MSAPPPHRPRRDAGALMEEPRAGPGGRGQRGLAALLRRMQEAVAAESTVQERLDNLTRVIARHIVADVCSIYLVRPSGELELYSTEGLNREAVHKTRLKLGEGLVGTVAATRHYLSTADAPLHPAFVYKAETGEDPLHSFLGVPLLRSGKVLGVLVLQNKASRRYTDDEIEAAEALATLLAEVAASGELLSTEETAAVGEMLHRPDRIAGQVVVPGVAIGEAVFHDTPVAPHKVFSGDVAEEAQRLEAAIDSLRASVDEMLADEELAGVSREVLEAYRLFAYDRGWKEKMRAAVFSGLTAETAVEKVRAENRARLSQARDPYLRERLHDLDDLSHRLQRHLAGEGAEKARRLPENAILIARSMGPADLLEYDRTRVKGLVIGEASATSHVAIVARALDIPLIAGVDDALDRIFPGDTVIVDGLSGEAHLRPTPEVIASYVEKRALQSSLQQAFLKEKDLPSVTKDGVAIEILMNAGLALDMPHLDATGAAGVGLFRTELQFLIGASLPRKSAQERLYREVLKLANGKPVVFRTADLGADKAAAYMTVERGGNPAMGWRGLRLAVDRPGILRPQIRALLAAAEGQDLSIMFPMVTLPAEIDAARAILDREIAWRVRHKKTPPSTISVGAMIETPAAAWALDAIAARTDFLSVGGNDLAQFFFAADRETDRVRRRYDALETAFLDFVRLIARKAAARDARISYCGEQTADPLVAAALLGLGFRRLSVPASSVGPFRRLIRSLDLGALTLWLEAALSGEGGSLRAKLAEFLKRSGVSVDTPR